MITYERVKVAKAYIEKKYRLKKEEEDEKKKDWQEIINRMKALNIPEEEAVKIKEEILHKEGENLRKKRQKISIFDFVPVKIIGKGAFGEVRICNYIPTGDVVAIKKMKKDEMHKKNQVLHVRTERDVLSEAKNEWIVELKFSFQDQKFLYLGMEFLPGGDLMNLLMERDIFPEKEAKFYAAEIVLAIESVHKMSCIHRDLKPDNILIDKYGHIKLSDFGLSKKLDFQLTDKQINQMNKNNLNNGGKNNNDKYISYAEQFNEFKMMKNKKRRACAFSTVGTPDYIAPEVFTQKGYGQEVDWWSLGVIMYEMMIGYPPFYSESSTETCKKILNWKNTLEFKKELNISNEAIDLLKKLITDPDKRLGLHGADEIKNHPFFKDVDWNHIKETLVPPFIPELRNAYDTRYFDEYEETEPFYPINNDNKTKYQKKDMCFVDFTYNRENEREYRINMVTALEVFDSIQESIRNINQETINKINEKNFFSSCGNKNKNNKRKLILNEEQNFSLHNNSIKSSLSNKSLNSNQNNKSNNNQRHNLSVNRTIANKSGNHSNLIKKQKFIINSNVLFINNKRIPLKMKIDAKLKPDNIFSNAKNYISTKNNKNSLALIPNSSKFSSSKNKYIKKIVSDIKSHRVSSGSKAKKQSNNSKLSFRLPGSAKTIKSYSKGSINRLSIKSIKSKEKEKEKEKENLNVIKKIPMSKKKPGGTIPHTRNNVKSVIKTENNYIYNDSLSENNIKNNSFNK